jgi:transcriptional antiterminator RfaH
MNWYVICTKPNTELKVASQLNSLGINAFCPSYSFIKKYSDRKKKAEKPLMPRYVLVKMLEKDRTNVFAVPNVIRYLFWLGKPAIVRHEEIEILKNELEGYQSISNKSSLNVGNDFAIPYGPFKGINGKILNFSNNRMRLELKNIGLFLTVNIS